MDFLLTALGVQLTWAFTRMDKPGDIRPRMVGSPISFEYFLTEVEADYSSEMVMGTLEGIHGNVLQVSGLDYDMGRTSSVKVWRKEIKR